VNIWYQIAYLNVGPASWNIWEHGIIGELFNQMDTSIMRLCRLAKIVFKFWYPRS